MLNIRDVHDTEVHKLLAIAKSTFIDTYEALNDPDNFKLYIAQHFSLDRIVEEYNNPNSNFYFTLVDNEVVGYFKINVADAQTESIDNAMEVERIYVLPNHKGQGIGRAMIDHVKTMAQENRLSCIWLGVWDQNPAALAFYQKMGFRKFDTHSFFIGEDEQTDFMMKIELT